MDNQVDRRKEIERQFTSLESYWEFDIPEALVHKDWSENAILEFFMEAMGVPAAKYDALVKLIGQEFRGEYSQRLMRLDELIQKHESAVKEMLNSK